ncbi:MAG TPA: PhnD/SsuA/transferrin family substrate-binding protein [Opitutaceae bacterium]|nr:PhnD/SsuA/transferrin family substrate-binding protein [Opitutaceae bacterium]
MNEPGDNGLPVGAQSRCALLPGRSKTALLPAPRIFAAALGLIATVALAGAAGSPGAETPATGTERPFKIAVTASMFTEVNENEARAAMRVWIMTVAKEHGIPVDSELIVYNDAKAALRAAETDRIDAYGATLEEFSLLSAHLAFDRLAIATRMDGFQENYVILVRQDSAWADLADLRGHDLLVLQNPRMSLASVWLDTVLLEKGLGTAAAFFGHIEEQNKPSRVALPVFFRKAAACLTTLKSFLAMQELNPQLGKQLRVLAQSPDLVSSVFVFRTDFHPSYRERLFQEMHRLSESPAGQQILTLLQAQRIDEQPFSGLDSSLALLARHRRLCAASPDARTGVSALPPVPAVSGKTAP